MRRTRFLRAQGLGNEQLLNIKQVSSILADWKADFEKRPEQQALITRDLAVSSKLRTSRKHGRWEQELRYTYHNANMVKALGQ